MTRWQSLDRTGHPCPTPWHGWVHHCPVCGALWLRGRLPVWLHRLAAALLPRGR